VSAASASVSSEASGSPAAGSSVSASGAASASGSSAAAGSAAAGSSAAGSSAAGSSAAASSPGSLSLLASRTERNFHCSAWKLRRPPLEHVRGARHPRLHGPGELGQQDLPRLDRRERLGLLGGHDPALHVAAPDLERPEPPERLHEPLGSIDRVAVDERDGGR